MFHSHSPGCGNCSHVASCDTETWVFTIDAIDRYQALLSQESSQNPQNSLTHTKPLSIPPSSSSPLPCVSQVLFFRLVPPSPSSSTLPGPSSATDSQSWGCEEEEEAALVHYRPCDLQLNCRAAQLSLLLTRDFHRHADNHRFAI